MLGMIYSSFLISFRISIDFLFQELSELQDVTESHETSLLIPSSSSPNDPSKTFPRQRSFHGQIGDVCRFPVERLGSDELHATSTTTWY